jgi:DNA invertase Pin-like site-specific DNA recombinase
VLRKAGILENMTTSTKTTRKTSKTAAIRNPGSDRRCGLYVRISDDTTGDEKGVERQRRDCRRYARERGWTIVAEFTENDVGASSYSKKKRPEYEHMLQLVASGDVDVVLSWSIDRLYRRPRELEDLIDLAETITVATPYGEYDLQTGEGRMQARILGSVAANESDKISRRVKAAAEQRAREGRSNGGERPYGLRDAGVLARPGERYNEIEPDEAAIVREMAQRVLAGEGLKAIARSLHERGVRTARGGTWNAGLLRRLLLQPRLAGFRIYNNEEIGNGAPQILDVKTFRKLQSHLAVLKPGAPRRHGTMTGVLRCGRCGNTLVSDGKSYRCHKRIGSDDCGRCSINKERTDEIVRDLVLEVLNDKQQRSKIERRKSASSKRARELHERDLDAEIDALEQRYDELALMRARNEIDARRFGIVKDELEPQLTALKRQRARANGNGVLAYVPDVVTEDQWDDENVYPPERKRAIIHAIWPDGIGVNPGTRGRTFDPERIQPTWA